ncbi:hypothetical protein Dimus_036924 [Dionaea muscipula]
MADPLPSSIPLLTRGCEEALGTRTRTEVILGGDGTELLVGDFPVTLSVESVSDGAPERWVVEGEEHQESEAEDRGSVLSSPCFSVMGSKEMKCAVADVAGVDVSGCSDEQQAGLVGIGGRRQELVELGVGGVGGEQVVDDGVGRDAKVMATATVSANLPILPYVPILPSLINSAVDIIADGFEREEVRVPPTAREALRPQPTDGLWKPPPSPVEPVAERVEKESGTMSVLLVRRRSLEVFRRVVVMLMLFMRTAGRM